MSLIEQLTQGLEAAPDDIAQVVDGVLRSDFDVEAAYKEYCEAEYSVMGLFKVLTSKRPVVQSTFNTYQAHHVKQWDMYKPIVLDDAATQLTCYPVHVYDEAQAIDGKREELRAKVIRPIARHTQTPYGLYMHEKWYGYLFAPSAVDLSQEEGALPMALEDVQSEYTTLTRSNPDNWLRSFRVDQGDRENQERFRQLTEELLVHEGHQQVPTWQ